MDMLDDPLHQVKRLSFFVSSMVFRISGVRRDVRGGNRCRRQTENAEGIGEEQSNSGKLAR